MSEKKFYVYIHRRATDGSIFYVGKGKDRRDKSRSGRSNHWKNIVNKNDYISERVAEGLSEDEAYKMEVSLITKLRSESVNICNIANGGNGGLSGIVLKDEHKEKLRKAKLGKKQMPEHAKKSACAKIGKKQPRSAVEYVIGLKKKKVINSDGEIFCSATEAAKALTERTGKYVSQGNISMCARGERSNAYGKTWSYNISVTPKFKPTMYRIKSVICSNGKIFESTTDAREWVASWRGSANSQTISYAARNSTPGYGFYWKYPESPA